MTEGKVVKPNDLADAISDIVQEYSDDIITQLPGVVQAVAKDSQKKLKRLIGEKFGGTGKYQRSIKVKKGSAGLNGKTTYTLYSTEGRLTHLLEKGHVIKNQTGKIYGMTQAVPHWSIVEEEAAEALEKKLTDKAGGNT